MCFYRRVCFRCLVMEVLMLLRKSLVVEPNFAAFSYIRSSYVSSTTDVARTVFSNLSLLDPPIKDF